MTCAAPNHRCNPLVTIRSPPGEALAALDFAASGSRPLLRVLRALRAAAEWLAREQLRCAAREIAPHLLDEIAASNPDAAQEIRKWFEP